MVHVKTCYHWKSGKVCRMFTRIQIWHVFQMRFSQFERGEYYRSLQFQRKWLSMEDCNKIAICTNRETLRMQPSWILLLLSVLPKFCFESQTILYLLCPTIILHLLWINKKVLNSNYPSCSAKENILWFAFHQHLAKLFGFPMNNGRSLQCLDVKGNLRDVNPNIACAAP